MHFPHEHVPVMAPCRGLRVVNALEEHDALRSLTERETCGRERAKHVDDHDRAGRAARAIEYAVDSDVR